MISQTQHHSNPNPNPNNNNNNHHHHLHVSREKSQDPTTKRTMKDFSFCSGDSAVRVADMGCSRSTSVISRYSFAAPNKGRPNIGSITLTYVSRLSSQKEVLIQLTWSRNNDGPILTVQMDDHDQLYINSCRKTSCRAISIQLSQEKRGNWTFTRGSYTVHLYWDVTFAVYSTTSPEPTSGFYVVMYVNSEFALLLGEIGKGNSNPLDRHGTEPSAQTCMISRKEQVHVLTSYTTKARFHPTDKDHKICVNFEADKQVLSVNVDDKPAVHVTKLKWNFRGSQTIFFEKTMVDVMWNLHGWLCDDQEDDGGGGARVARNVNAAWFMFRTRSSLEEWLWQVEDQGAMSCRSSVFTIEAFKRRD